MNKKVSGAEVLFKTLIPIVILVVIYNLQMNGHIDVLSFRTHPFNGVSSIFTGTLLHADLNHLLGNLIPLMIGIPIIVKYFNNQYWNVILLGWVLPGALMFYLTIPSIGISGLSFAVAFFVMFAGLLSKKKTPTTIGVLFGLSYGKLIVGATVLAGYMIAWQAHAAGLLIAIILAVGTIEVQQK